MILLKLALWYDPQWRTHLHTKGNWHKRAYWLQRKVTLTTGSYTLGPLRLEINLAGVDKDKAADLERRLLRKGK